MTFFSKLLVICMLALSAINSGFGAQKDNFYRSFLQPKYHGERLNYCTLDGKCGSAVATNYCKLMGYAYADQQIIDHNVGLTNYLFCDARCKGWRCNGFKVIRCVANMSHKPPRTYHYRLRRFVYPRFDNYRIDWCYDGHRGCGRKAAHSFCRRMGYLDSRKFAIEKNIAATKAIGNQKLCFGTLCNAFAYINCYR
ncbi:MULTISPECIES: hypothetical protein [unclassified Legionella]|uniref:hypothetical protein n=1 Tax=unclassified Legionella TaxID=2622702 RepID=UPI001056A737|nr:MULTISPECIES: hypothetical protein [unclassified Legionella]MDI9818578.1 hypothetical protein [Legionella sp. PL877]